MGWSRPSHPPPQEVSKVGNGVPLEKGSSQVHNFDVKVLRDGLDCYVVSGLSLHILGLGDVQVPNF